MGAVGGRQGLEGAMVGWERKERWRRRAGVGFGDELAGGEAECYKDEAVERRVRRFRRK